MSDHHPTFDTYITPLLSLLAEHPAGLTTTQAYDLLADRLSLTHTQRTELLPSGTQPVYQNRIGWAHDRLKRADLSASIKRGVWAITDRGQQFIRSSSGVFTTEQIHALARPDFTTKITPIHKNPTPINAPTETFTGLEAAKIILADVDQPLHYNELTRQILAQGLWTTTGQTPAATINALIAVDIKKHGELSDFRRAQPGHYYLNIDGLESPSHTEFLETEPSEEIPPETTPEIPSNTITPLSFTDAAERILQVFAEREPMHFTDITARALDLHLIVTEGQSPANTMSASIIQETNRRKERGDTPRFELLGNGLIGLTRWHQSGLTAYIEAHNDSVRRRLHERLHETDPARFEQIVGQLLTAIGFHEVTVTTRQNDGGIDVRGTLVVGDVIRTRMAVQVKRWKANVSSPTVQQVRGSLGSHEQGLIITTSDFSPGAYQEAQRPDATPVGLMNGTQLVKLLIQHNIGVEKDDLSLLRLG